MIKRSILGIVAPFTLSGALISLQANADSCSNAKERASLVFNRCLSGIQAAQNHGANKITIANRIARCENAHTKNFAKIESEFDLSCAGTINSAEAKARVFYAVNQRSIQTGGTPLLSPTPGSDVLVWTYPSWTSTTVVQTALGAQSNYNSNLVTNGYQKAVGNALPIIAYHPAATDAPNCPYASSQGTYIQQLTTLKNTAGEKTIIGIASIGNTQQEINSWRGFSSSSIQSCLNNFTNQVSGLMIDDEYNVLSQSQIDTMLKWCLNQPSFAGRCGLVLGHNEMIINTSIPASHRQDICMDFGTNSPQICASQNPGYTRNLFNNTVPAKNTSVSASGSPLPFSILANPN